MARTGTGKFIGYAQETTPGTRVTPTRFLPHIDDDLKKVPERIESAATVPGELYVTSDQWRTGAVSVTGPVGHELYVGGMGLIFYNILGAKATSGAGPYVHTITAGSLDGLAMTIQSVRPDVGNTNRVFEATGCKIASAQIGCAVGQAATVGLDVVGMDLVTNQSAATASYGTKHTKPFVFVDGSVTVGGTAAKLRTITTDFTNAMNVERRFLGQATTSEPLENDRRECIITAEGEFESLTHYAAFIAGSEVAVVQTFTDGTHSAVITMTCRYDEANPSQSGRDIIAQPLTLKAIDMADIEVVITNADATC